MKENGKGIPDMAILLPLCQILEISVNEFMSGERLGEENYSQKAEENMMKLLQENEDVKMKNKQSIAMFFAAIAAIAAVLVPVFLTTSSGTGVGVIYILDFPTLICILFGTALVLWVSGLMTAFGKAFVILCRLDKDESPEEVEKAKVAVNMVAHMWLGLGIFVSIIRFIYISFCSFEGLIDVKQQWANIAISMLGGLYGVAGYLILVLIRSRLELLGKRKSITY